MKGFTCAKKKTKVVIFETYLMMVILLIFVNFHATKIYGVLRDLVPFVEFKKREKHP